MNYFVAMLKQELPKTPQPSQNKRSGNPNPDHSHANAAKKAQAIARYKSVMWEEWTVTTLIESRLGMSRSSAYPSLSKWESQGLLEKRDSSNVGKKTNRSRSVEWRWK